MKNILSKYKYHHKILKEIACPEKGWFSESRKKGEGLSDLPNDEYLSKKFRIPIYLVKEITTELKELKCISGVSGVNGSGYFTAEKSEEYINLRYFIHKRNEYLRDLIILNIKDFLLITTSVLAIYSFFSKSNENEKNIKLIEGEISIMKSKQESLKLELLKKIDTLKDSL